MPTIGIDLGTTNSLVSYWNGKHPELIPNVFGSFLTPSVVAIDDSNNFLIGDPAKERLVSIPQDGAANFKRFMGTDKKYQLKNYALTPVDLSAMILKSLKEDAETFFGEPVTDAIVSIPAYFNEHQRMATINAGKIAGLNVLKLITEPTAAAIAYGLHIADSETTFAVLDLGGGTYDVSILEMFEGVMEVRSIAGDVFLGGIDFTEAIFKSICLQENIDTNLLSDIERGQLLKLAEVCKRTLTEQEQCELTYKLNDEHKVLQYNRQKMEVACKPLILKFKLPVERALRDAKIKPSDIDNVILIGGATRMQHIKHTVGLMFNKLPFTNIHPDEAVALGISVQIALKEKHEEVAELVMTDVCPFTLGIAITDGIAGKVFSPIIERNTCIPCSRSSIYSTAQDNQTTVNLEVYQGESLDLNNNLRLGSFEIHVPKDAAGKEPVDVRFTYDGNGLLEIEATILSNKRVYNHIIEKAPGHLSKEEIQKRLDKLKDLKIHPRDQQENVRLLSKANRIYEELLGVERNRIAEGILFFKNALESQEPITIRQAQKEFTDFLEQFERNHLF